MAETWTNSDGLTVLYGTREGKNIPGGREIASSGGGEHILRIPFAFDNLPDYTADLNNDGTLNGFRPGDVHIPANCIVKEAYLVVRAAWVGGTSLTVGGYIEAGTVVDADGWITAANAAVANMNEIGNYVPGTGADLAAVTVTAETSKTFIKVVAAGTFTAGEAELVLKYLVPMNVTRGDDGDRP